MAMPKNITLINKRSEKETVLDFQHAERLLKLELKNGTNSFSVKGKYIFNGNDIIRRPVTKEDQGDDSE